MQTAEQQSRVTELLREHQALKAIRYNWESYWADIARYIHPNNNVFMRALLGTPYGERRTEFIFESTPPQALESFAAIMEMMLFPRTQRWHKLTPIDPSLKDNRNVRAYLEDMTDVMFASRYSPRSNFASNAHECMKDIGAFGTTSLFIDEDMGANIRYRSVPLQDLYFAINHVGVIDRVFREFIFTPLQAAEEWGKDSLPESVKSALENKPHQPFQWLHVVRPRKDPAYGRNGRCRDAAGVRLPEPRLQADRERWRLPSDAVRDLALHFVATGSLWPLARDARVGGYQDAQPDEHHRHGSFGIGGAAADPDGG